MQEMIALVTQLRLEHLLLAGGSIMIIGSLSFWSLSRKAWGEEILYRAHPSMFRNKPIRFLVCLCLCCVVVGIPVFLAWWIKCLRETLIVTNEKVVKRTGIIAKQINEVYLSDIKGIYLEQGFMQRIFGVGSIGVASSATAGIEVTIAGIPKPGKVKRILESQRQQRNGL